MRNRDIADFSKVEVSHPAWYSATFDCVVRVVRTARSELGKPGCGAWVEMWDGSRWCLPFKVSPGIPSTGKLSPLSKEELQWRGIPLEPFPEGYDIPALIEQSFWQTERILRAEFPKEYEGVEQPPERDK